MDISGINVSGANLSDKGILGGNGQSIFTTPGTYSWTAPVGVKSVSAVVVGGGGGCCNLGGADTYGTGGGGGGGLTYGNNIPVVPGQSYTVFVGAGGANGRFPTALITLGQESYFISNTHIYAAGGQPWTGGADPTYYVGGGGGAGGYSGVGGRGSGKALADGPIAAGGVGCGTYATGGGNGGIGGGGIGVPDVSAAAGSGGAGGGGYSAYNVSYSGGGVGLYGTGSNGSAGTSTSVAGGPGSGGSAKLYGGGAGKGGSGGGGAVRIIWGEGRSYPSTLVQDL
jgi:hypothetical protein